MNDTKSSATLRYWMMTALVLGGAACEAVSGGADSGYSGPYTVCTYQYPEGDKSLKGYGEDCTTNEECAHGVCMMPGDSGNITNTQFGFCTRGCDCNDDEASRLTEDEKENYECIYPPTPDQNSRHVVIECTSLDFCLKISDLYTECSTSSGTARKVCKAL